MRRLVPLLLAAAVAGCGDDTDPPAPVATPTATASPAPTGEPQGSTGGGAPFVGSLTVDPGDGTVIAGTGLGLYRVERGSAEPFDGELTTPSGAGAISPNLVVRYSAPGELVGSGHPKDPDSGLPENLGLIRSSDGGASWKSVSLLGDEDLHALDVRGDVIAGQPVEAARVIVSADGGATFEERTPPAAPLDVDLDPRDPSRIAITTEDGLFVSRDGGRSWRQRAVLTAETHLAWADDGTLYRVDASGTVQESDDGGERWRRAGDAGGSPTTVTVDAEGRLYVALPGGVIARSDDGGRSFEEIAALKAP